MNLTIWLALGGAARLVVALLFAHLTPAAVAALTAALVAAVWAVVLWRTRAGRRRDYHRHGRPGVRHHIRPTRRRRARLAARRLRSLRLVAAEAAAPAAPTTVPDSRPFTARAA